MNRRDQTPIECMYFAQEEALALMNDVPIVSGYDYGSSRAARSLVTLDELRGREATMGWSSADAKALPMAGEVLAGREEAMVDRWRAIIGGQEHLAKWLFAPDGKPDEAYKRR